MTAIWHGTWLWVSTALTMLLAAAVAYTGIAVALSVALANRDGAAVAACAGYTAAGFAAPVAVGWHLVRSRDWPLLRAVRCAAGLSLMVHAVLVPVALAAMAM